MSKNIVNRLFTTFMLLIAIISAQEMTQKYSDQRLTIRIENPKDKVVNIHGNYYPVYRRKHSAIEITEDPKEPGFVTSHQ